MTENGQGGVPQPGTPHQAQPVPAPGYPQQPGPQAGEAWGAPPGYGYPQEQEAQGEQGRDRAAQDPQQYAAPYGAPYEPAPQPGQPAYGYPPPAGHVVGPGFEGPGDPHGYGYPPLPEAATQYIPPVRAAAHEQATQYIPPVPQHEQATQYIPPVQASAHEQATQYIPPVQASAHEQATQYIPPVPEHEQATQYMPPVPPAPQHEQATQHIPPVPGAPAANTAEGFDALFRTDADAEAAGHTQQLPPVPDPGPRRTPPPAPPQQYGPRRPQPPQQPQPQQPQQQYAPPPPPPAPGRRIPPAVIAAAVFGLAVAGLGVGALLGDGKAQNTDPGAVAPAASGSAGSGAAPGEEAVDPARPQAVQLDKLLADSNDSRASVIKAVDDIKDCKNLGQAAQDLRDAARQREELVTRLQELKMDRLPNHARLAAALTKAWKASADADNSYASWADDAAHDKGGCKDGKAKATDDAADGNKSSAEATKAKESAAAMWNSIAAKYGLTQRDKSQL
ncbi:hypothetical protein AB0D45_16415 [Streptomyces sp. NPDC048352]|uniref:hypothetical protein n=1 Tax=Streptomyces sp. NPDC048352 TaxID=3154718 RepID=UPI0034147EF9